MCGAGRGSLRTRREVLQAKAIACVSNEGKRPTSQRPATARPNHSNEQTHSQPKPGVRPTLASSHRRDAEAYPLLAIQWGPPILTSCHESRERQEHQEHQEHQASGRYIQHVSGSRTDLLINYMYSILRSFPDRVERFSKFHHSGCRYCSP